MQMNLMCTRPHVHYDPKCKLTPALFYLHSAVCKVWFLRPSQRSADIFKYNLIVCEMVRTIQLELSSTSNVDSKFRHSKCGLCENLVHNVQLLLPMPFFGTANTRIQYMLLIFVCLCCQYGRRHHLFVSVTNPHFSITLFLLSLLALEVNSLCKFMSQHNLGSPGNFIPAMNDMEDVLPQGLAFLSPCSPFPMILFFWSYVPRYK